MFCNFIVRFKAHVAREYRSSVLIPDSWRIIFRNHQNWLNAEIVSMNKCNAFEIKWRFDPTTYLSIACRNSKQYRSKVSKWNDAHPWSYVAARSFGDLGSEPSSTKAFDVVVDDPDLFLRVSLRCTCNVSLPAYAPRRIDEASDAGAIRLTNYGWRLACTLLAAVHCLRIIVIVSCESMPREWAKMRHAIRFDRCIECIDSPKRG